MNYYNEQELGPGSLPNHRVQDLQDMQAERLSSRGH